MNTSRSLLAAVIFGLALAALAQAQIYVSNPLGIRVYTLDGTLLEDDLIPGFSGSNDARYAISGTDMFVTNFMDPVVRRYTTAGTLVNGAVYDALALDLTNVGAQDIILVGSTLYVAHPQYIFSPVFTLATNGTLLGAPFIAEGVLQDPRSMAVSGSTLYILSASDGTVGTYDANTGAAINPTFIAGLTSAGALALSGADLFVRWQDGDDNVISRYNANTGALVSANLIPSLTTASWVSVAGGSLYVGHEGGIGQYGFDGTEIDAQLIADVTYPGFFLVVPQAIPEPSTYAAVAGLLGLGAVLWRRRRQGVVRV